MDHKDIFIFFSIAMHNLKSQKKNIQTQSLIDTLSKYRDIADYFKLSCPPAQYEQLAVQLIRYAIANRNRNQKHYHVAYIKHNRFLSPSQKKDVMPKVTEIIPVNQQPIKIYGKPKVKLDDQYLMPAEQVLQYISQPQVQDIERSESQRNLEKHLPPRDPIEKQQKNQKQQIIDNPDNDKKQNEVQKVQETYMSPRNTQNMESQKQIRNSLENFKEQYQYRSTQNEKKKRRQPQKPDKQDLKIQSNFKTTMKPEKSNVKLQETLSPKNAGRTQKYEEVESKIKFLIERDKKNKRLENKLEEQNRKIQKLEQRQERLLLRQYERSKEMNRKTTKKRKQMSCCCSSDEEINSKLLEMRNYQNYSSHKTLSQLHSKISPVKSYKISAEPIYPITSSDSSDSSESEIVVAVR